MAEVKRTWLAGEIDSAKSSVDSWPNWMRNSAHFEGRDHHLYTNNSVELCRIDRNKQNDSEVDK